MLTKREVAETAAKSGAVIRKIPLTLIKLDRDVYPQGHVVVGNNGGQFQA